VGVHAEPRFTQDLDIFVGTNDENLLRVVRAFERFGAPAHIVEALRTLGADEFLFLGVPPARVDVLRTIPGVEFEAAYARKLRVEWDGLVADVIGREDLLAANRAAGREKDLRIILRPALYEIADLFVNRPQVTRIVTLEEMDEAIAKGAARGRV
jgi:hypothetical protein